MTKTYTLTARNHNGGGRVEEHDAESIGDFLDSLKRAVKQGTLVPDESYTIKVKEMVAQHSADFHEAIERSTGESCLVCRPFETE